MIFFEKVIIQNMMYQSLLKANDIIEKHILHFNSFIKIVCFIF